MTYVLCRIEDDATTTAISQHADIVSGIAEGKRIVAEDDWEFPYSLHTEDGCRVAVFGEGRIGVREWMRRTGRLDTIHSQDDKYLHDEDRLAGVS